MRLGLEEYEGREKREQGMFIAYFAARVAEAVVECCGGSKETARVVSMVTSSALAVVDPIGALANMGHVSAKVAADEGSEVGDAIDKVMTLA